MEAHVAVEKKKKKKHREGGDAEAKATTKKTKAEKKPKEPSRKDYIISLIQDAGKAGIATSKLVEQTDKKFLYEEGKTSRMRVNNTVKELVAEGKAAVKDGNVIWKKG